MTSEDYADSRVHTCLLGGVALSRCRADPELADWLVPSDLHTLRTASDRIITLGERYIQELISRNICSLEKILLLHVFWL